MARIPKKTAHPYGKKSATAKMVSLTKRVSRYDDGDAYETLTDLIDKQLGNGNDKVLFKALDLTETLEDEETLEDAAEDCVSNLAIGMVMENGAVAHIESRLFAVPIIGIIEKDFKKSALSDEDLSAMMTCMRRNGVIQPENSIMMLPDFFKMENLGVGFLEVLEHHKVIIDSHMSKNEAKILEAMAQAKQSFPVNTATVSLRFLVGVILGEGILFPDETLAMMAFDDEEENSETPIEGYSVPDLEVWHNEVSEIVSGYFNREISVHAGMPFSYYKGIKEGVFTFQAMAAIATFSLALKSQRIDPSEALIRATSFEDEPKISLMLSDKNGRIIEAVNWEFPDFYSGTISKISENLISVENAVGVQVIDGDAEFRETPLIRAMVH